MKKKINWIITALVVIMLLVLIVGSFFSVLLLYVLMFFLGVLTIISMVRIDSINLGLIKNIEEKTVKETKKEETKEEKLDTSPSPPFDDAISLANQYLKEGYTKEEIEEGLKEKYDDFTIDFIMKQVEGGKQNGS